MPTEEELRARSLLRSEYPGITYADVVLTLHRQAEVPLSIVLVKVRAGDPLRLTFEYPVEWT